MSIWPISRSARCFVELDLDSSRYLKGQQKLLQDAQSTSLNIESNFKNLGIKSSAEMDLMRAKIANSYNMIANSSKATANDRLRAEQAMHEQLEKLNEKQFGKQTTIMQSLKSNWIAVAGAIATAAGTIYKVFDMTVAGAAIERQQKAFDNLSKSVGANSQEMLESLKSVSRGMVADADLIKAAGTSMMMGLRSTDLVQFMRIAEATSRQTGQSVTEAFNDITLGVARQSKMILDNLGIVVDVEKSYDKYASTIGKTASALSDAEKKQAFLNEVLSKGNELIIRIGESKDEISGVNQLMASMSNLVSEASKTVVDKLNPAFVATSKIIDALTRGIKTMNAEIQNMGSDTVAKQMEKVRQALANPDIGPQMRKYFEDQLAALEKRVGDFTTNAREKFRSLAAGMQQAFTPAMKDFVGSDEARRPWNYKQDTWIYDTSYLDVVVKENEKAAAKIKSIWEGWFVRPGYSEAEAADQKMFEEWKKNWKDFGQRPYQESEAVLADQQRWEAWKKEREKDWSDLTSMSERTADAIEQSFADLAFDAFTGKLKSLQDYFAAFANTMARIASDLMGQLIKTGLFGSSSNGSSMGGLFGSLFSGGGGPQQLGQYGESSLSGASAQRPSFAGVAAGGNVSISIANHSGQKAEVTRDQRVGGERQIEIMIGSMVTSGGPVARSMQSTFGARRVGRLV